MEANPNLAEYRLDPDAPRPLYLQLRDHLVADIRRGRYRAGSAIPSISTLEASTNASRVTIVRALARLVEDGFTFPQAGKGYYVAERGAKLLLAVVAPFDLRPMHYSSQLLAGAELAAGPAGYDLLEVNGGQTGPEFTRAVQRAVYERGARSLVLVPPDDSLDELPRLLKKLPIANVVIADREVPEANLPSVVQDRPAAYALLAGHLAERGARRIATHGFAELASALHRAMRDAGLAVMADELTGDESADELAQACDALCCADDVIAGRIYLRAKDAAGRLPVALTGFNHTAHGHVVAGGLTTIDPGFTEMGMQAVRLIADADAPGASAIHIAPRLIVGASSQLPRTTPPQTGDLP